MKYSIIINQAGVVDAGLGGKTDLIDWAIIDYIMGWQTVPSAARINNHVWVNLKHLGSEMPMIGINTKSELSRRITKLSDLGLITKLQDDFGRLYVAITSSCHGITSFRAAVQPSFNAGSNGSPQSNGVLPTVLISNLGIDAIKDAVGERIIDRLREDGGDLVAFDWDSHRKH